MVSAESDSVAAASATGKLARLALRGSIFTLLGRGAIELLRFGSSLLLTRLLAPEAFGLMLVVNAVVQGARMVSDLGIRGSIVSHPRGSERTFLDTAWTVQIVRGAAICAGLLLGADLFASLEGHPEAAPLIRITALCALIEGFTSTTNFYLVRQVRPGRAIGRDLAARALGIAVTVVWALVSPSVSALLAGALTASIAQVALSHRMIPGYRDSLAWEPQAVRAISGFGRWVFLATGMTYLLNRGDALVLATQMSKVELGVYAIALGLPQAIAEVVRMIAGNVLFPVYARMNTLALEVQRKEVGRYRLVVLAAALPGYWALALGGPELIGLLYDSRYAEAGWMLQLVAVATIPMVVSLSAERVLMARGDSFSHLILQASQATLLFGGMWAGHLLASGPRGVIVGMVVGRLAGYVPLALLVRRRGMWQPGVDALALGISAVVLYAGFSWRGMP